jgi:hypothetical protein
LRRDGGEGGGEGGAAVRRGAGEGGGEGARAAKVPCAFPHGPPFTACRTRGRRSCRQSQRCRPWGRGAPCTCACVLAVGCRSPARRPGSIGCAARRAGSTPPLKRLASAAALGQGRLAHVRVLAGGCRSSARRPGSPGCAARREGSTPPPTRGRTARTAVCPAAPGLRGEASPLRPRPSHATPRCRRLNYWTELVEKNVLPYILMHIPWRHLTHTKIRKARRTWSPSVGP